MSNLLHRRHRARRAEQGEGDARVDQVLHRRVGLRDADRTAGDAVEAEAEDRQVGPRIKREGVVGPEEVGGRKGRLRPGTVDERDASAEVERETGLLLEEHAQHRLRPVRGGGDHGRRGEQPELDQVPNALLLRVRGDDPSRRDLERALHQPRCVRVRALHVDARRMDLNSLDDVEGDDLVRGIRRINCLHVLNVSEPTGTLGPGTAG